MGEDSPEDTAAAHGKDIEKNRGFGEESDAETGAGSSGEPRFFLGEEREEEKDRPEVGQSVWVIGAKFVDRVEGQRRSEQENDASQARKEGEGGG